MKIIKKGCRPEDVVFRGTCGRCQTQFECSRTEGSYTGNQRDGPYLRVKCPLCGYEACAYETSPAR